MCGQVRVGTAVTLELGQPQHSSLTLTLVSCQMLVRYYTVDTDKDQETVFLPLRCDLTWLIWFQCLLGALQVAVLLLTWSAVVNTSPQ